MRKLHCLVPIVVVGVLVYTSANVAVCQERPSGEVAKSYVTYLADDALEGRDTGTPGHEKAAAWVAEHFQDWGLEPAGENGTYFQDFTLKYYKSDFDYPTFRIEDRDFYYEDEDFSVLRYSGGGKVSGEAVFVGYGINAPDKELDEYAGLDVKGKIVLVMRGCPGDDEDKWEDVRTDSAKVAMAQEHGATGLLLCADFKEEDRGIGRWRLAPGNYKEGFLVFGVDKRVVQFLLRKKDEMRRAFERRMRDEQAKLDKDLKPISMATGKKATLEVEVEYDPEKIGRNVLAKINGTDPDVADEVVVLGAHLDHLGVCYGQVYNGADDNASGSAVVMEVGRVMSANNVTLRRTILFACWAGEERGLLGSRHYAEHPIFPIEKTVLNLNMDMVGIGEKLGFPGTYYAPNIWSIIKENISDSVLAFIEPQRGGPGGSDHTPFITRGVPAFALMTSPWRAHSDYHQPGDDADKIDAELLGKVAQFVYDEALLAANYEEDLVVENRLPLYIHKSATIVSLHPVPYEPEMAVLDSLQDEWVDLQFVELSLDTLKGQSERLAALVKALDSATKKLGDPSRFDRGMAMMFSSRRENTSGFVGLHGAQSVNSDLAELRIAGKLGAKFFVFDSFDSTWIVEGEGLTKDGRKAIRELNDQKMLIIAQNLPEDVLLEIIHRSKKPVVVAGVADPSDTLLVKIEENEGLLALGFCPHGDAGRLADKILSLKEKTSLHQLGLYPCFGEELDVASLDKMLQLTVALKEKEIADRDITNLLGGNVRSVLSKVLPQEGRRMRRPF